MKGTGFTTRRSSLRRVLLPSLLLPLWGLLISAPPAQGQIEVVRGTTVDDATGQVVAGALIELLDNDLEVAKTMASDSLGDFILVTPGPGLYALRGSHADYLNQMSLPVELEPGATAHVTLRLSRTTVLLDPMDVTLEADDDPLARNASIRTSRNGAIDGEIVRGTTVANETGTIVGQVRVQLLSEAEEVLEETVSDGDGRFFIRTPGPGTYMMRSSRLGYEEQKSLPFTLAEGDNAVASFQLSPDAILLDPLTVAVEAIDPFMAEFHDRRRFFGRSGRGKFFEREEIQPWTGTPLAVAVSALDARFYPGYSRGRGSIIETVVRGELCEPFIFLNGFRARGIEDIPVDALASVQSLGAIEIYRGTLNVPAELWDSATDPPCAAIVFWTHRGGG